MVLTVVAYIYTTYQSPMEFGEFERLISPLLHPSQIPKPNNNTVHKNLTLLSIIE